MNDFDFRNFESPALQKFYSHLQAHALNEKDVQLRPDMLEPDLEGFNKFSDVVDLIKETVRMDCEGIGMGGGTCRGAIKEEDSSELNRRGKVKKEHGKEQVKVESSKSTARSNEPESLDVILRVEGLLLNADLKSVKVPELKQYLRMNGLDDKGKKE